MITKELKIRAWNPLTCYIGISLPKPLKSSKVGVAKPSMVPLKGFQSQKPTNKGTRTPNSVSVPEPNRVLQNPYFLGFPEPLEVSSLGDGTPKKVLESEPLRT